MKRSISFTLLLGWGVLFALGCRSKSREDPCLANCQLRSKELSCEHPQLCAQNCEKVAKASVCKKPMDAFMACALPRPKDDWECSGAGIAVLRHRACEHEQDDVLICLQKSQGKL